MTVDEALRATLLSWRRGGISYGTSDCLLAVANYASLVTGKDVGAPWRGTYTTQAEALDIVRAAGGSVPLLGGALQRAGLRPVSEAARGDCLVIAVQGTGVEGV